MSKNQKYANSKHIALPLPYDRAPGEPVLVGGFAGIALNGGKSGETAPVWLDGSYDVTVTGELTPGATVFITPTGDLTATAAGNKAWGGAITAKAAQAGTAEVTPFGRVLPTA